MKIKKSSNYNFEGLELEIKIRCKEFLAKGKKRRFHALLQHKSQQKK